MKNNVFVILGPTSSGKTSLALNLCKKLGGSIISADSRQIYKYMDIGTGKKPISASVSIERGDNKWVFDGIDVWGYDLVSPGEYFSVYDYAQFALEKIGELSKAGTPIFLVGGTGFYIDVVMGRKSLSGILPDFTLRSELNSLDTASLLKKAMSLNIRFENESEEKNRNRIIRKIEKKLAEEKNQTPLPSFGDIDFVYFGLSSSRDVLYARADLWTEKIWENGLVQEVEKLLEMGFKETPQLNGLVYKSVLSYFGNSLSKKDSLQRIKYDLHAYIRRQQTWFKKNSDVKWFDIKDFSFYQEIEREISENL